MGHFSIRIAIQKWGIQRILHTSRLVKIQMDSIMIINPIKLQSLLVIVQWLSQEDQIVVFLRQVRVHLYQRFDGLDAQILRGVQI